MNNRLLHRSLEEVVLLVSIILHFEVIILVFNNNIEILSFCILLLCYLYGESNQVMECLYVKLYFLSFLWAICDEDLHLVVKNLLPVFVLNS